MEKIIGGCAQPSEPVVGLSPESAQRRLFGIREYIEWRGRFREYAPICPLLARISSLRLGSRYADSAVSHCAPPLQEPLAKRRSLITSLSLP